MTRSAGWKRFFASSWHIGSPLGASFSGSKQNILRFSQIHTTFIGSTQGKLHDRLPVIGPLGPTARSGRVRLQPWENSPPAASPLCRLTNWSPTTSTSTTRSAVSYGTTIPTATFGATGFTPSFMTSTVPVSGEFRICRHFHPRVQNELSQSFYFLIFKRGNQIQTGLFKG
jgi:hypothetical protein